jgi:hypothetical protein
MWSPFPLADVLSYHAGPSGSGTLVLVGRGSPWRTMAAMSQGRDDEDVLPTGPGPHTVGTAVLAFVLAVVSWITLPVLLAVVALLVARSADRVIAADPQAGGSGLVLAARWVAWVQLVLVAMAVAFVAAFFLALWVVR